MADAKFKVDPKKATQKQLEEAFELLAKKNEREDKIKRGVIKGHAGKAYSEMTADEKKQRQAYSKKRMIRQSLLVAKAKAAGITVSEKEVDEYLSKGEGKKPTK
jgi:hypothetical protein